MLAQLDLGEASNAKPNVIGNAEEFEHVNVTNLNWGKSNKSGLGAYNLSNGIHNSKSRK